MSENANAHMSNQKKKQEETPLNAKEEVSEFFKTALIAITIAVLIRSFFYEPFNIPSGSMKPTLQVGDYLFVHKPAYGYSRYSFPFGIVPIEGRFWNEGAGKTPQRGDVVVFKLPSNTNIDYIKRIVAMPGESVQMKNGRLYINDIQIPRTPNGLKTIENLDGSLSTLMEYTETLPGGVEHPIFEETDSGILDDTKLYTVPDGHYFMMGDNRDNSQDSRVTGMVGPVPIENFVGKADFIFFSTNGKSGLLEFWNWPKALRYSRFFKSLEPTRQNDDTLNGANGS